GDARGRGGAIDHERARKRRLAGVAGHESADALERVGGDAPAVAQAARKLAVVDCAPPKGRLRKPGLTAEIGDFPQDRVVHGACPRAFGSLLFCPELVPERTKSTLGRQPQTVPQGEWAEVWASIEGRWALGFRFGGTDGSAASCLIGAQWAPSQR